MKNLIGSFFIIAIVAACSTDAIYTKAFRFKNSKWGLNDHPKFIVEIKDTTQLYDFIFTLRSTTDYAFSNLWIFLRTTPPYGKSVREPFEIKIADPKGNWIGNKSGTVVENELSFKRRKVPFKGKYIFELDQAITQKKVDELLDISLEVRKSDTQ